MSFTAPMKCVGCLGDIVSSKGWITVTRKWENFLGDHAEMETEAQFVACSWDCVLDGGRVMGLDGRREQSGEPSW